MRTTYEIDCLKFSKLSISSPPNACKDYRNASNGGSSSPDFRQNGTTTTTSYKPLLPRLEFPTNQFGRLLHMDQKEFKNNWRSGGYENEKGKKK